MQSNISSVAIVGMACRFPGNVSSLADFWILLSRSRDGWREVPKDRFSQDSYFHPNTQRPSSYNIKGGYFVSKDFSEFDAPFFHVGEEEAVSMDPQQRQLLEVAYEALENAGVSLDSISGTNMGVYVASRPSDYRYGITRDDTKLPITESTGNQTSIQANRLSYFFNLHGPSITIDTACSSGLHAVHLAAQAIRCGDCDSALVAGCCLRLQPDDMISMSMMGLYNEDGRSHAFDHRGNGYGPGEGVGCLVLKSLNKATEDNDNIRSVIVGTGVNQDGRTSGMTNPNDKAQKQLILDVYNRAGVDRCDVGFVEAHGTGTKVGDLTEATSLFETLGAIRDTKSPLLLGSVKTNIGHLENVSGIASVIKASLMLEAGLVLPNANFEKLKETTPLPQWNMKIPRSVLPWPAGKKYVSVSNFGFGGANAHAVLEKAPLSAVDESTNMANAANPKLFVISANSVKSLEIQALQLQLYVQKYSELFEPKLVKNIAYTLGERRSHLQYRATICARTLDELNIALTAPIFHSCPASRQPKLAFVYTGQGAQWPTMAFELFKIYSVFAESLMAADEAIRELGADFSIVREIEKSKVDSRVNEPFISQPACTAIQIGLTDLLRSWGIQPSFSIGHSSGEIGAAYTACAITRTQAMTIAYFRGQLASKLRLKKPELKGAMLAVAERPATVRQIIDGLNLYDLNIACENSPSSVTVSGDDSEIQLLMKELDNSNIFRRKLRVDVAYHSHHMKHVAEDYHMALYQIHSTDRGVCQMYSSLYGREISTTLDLDASYWVNNLTHPVLFAPAMQKLCQEHHLDVIVEIGPHAALEGPIKQILSEVDYGSGARPNYLPSLLRTDTASTNMVKLAGALFSNGHALDFSAINRPNTEAQKPHLIKDFTPYPWEKFKYWTESRASKQRRYRPFPMHDILGLLEAPYSEIEPVWHQTINISSEPWLRDYRVQKRVEFPLAAYLAMAIEAARQNAQLLGISHEAIDSYSLHNAQVKDALHLQDNMDYEIRTAIYSLQAKDGEYQDMLDTVRISTWNSERGWLQHFTCQVSRTLTNESCSTGTERPGAINFLKAAHNRDNWVTMKKFYDNLHHSGLHYGPRFKIYPPNNIRVANEWAIGTIENKVGVKDTQLHFECQSLLTAASLDKIIQHIYPILGAGTGHREHLFLPDKIGKVEVYNTFKGYSNKELHVIAHGRSIDALTSANNYHVDVWHFSQLIRPVIRLSDIHMVRIETPPPSTIDACSMCYTTEWNPVEVPETIMGVHHSPATEKGEEERSPPSYLNINSCSLEKTEHVVILSNRAVHDNLVSKVSKLIESNTHYKFAVMRLEDVKPGPSHYISLLELDDPVLFTMDKSLFSTVQKLIHVASSILWVTRGAYKRITDPRKNLVQGFFRAIRSETEKIATTLDLDPITKPCPGTCAKLVYSAFQCSLDTRQRRKNKNFEFAQDGDELVAPCFIEQREINDGIFGRSDQFRPYLQRPMAEIRRLMAATPMSRSAYAIYWMDDEETGLEANEIEIKILATGITLNDVLKLQGRANHLGIECAGIVSRVGCSVGCLQIGDRVCALVRGAYGTFGRAPWTSAVKIPEEMAFHTAATMPLAYSSAYHAVFNVARVISRQHVAVHDPCGDIGQAVIQFAQMAGAVVHVIVKNFEEKSLLIARYAISCNSIFYEDDSCLVSALETATAGQGIDVMIYPRKIHLSCRSFASVSRFGMFVAIVQGESAALEPFKPEAFGHNQSLACVNIPLLAAIRPKQMHQILRSVMDQWLGTALQSICPTKIIGLADVNAFLTAHQQKPIHGKAVVDHTKSTLIPALHPTPRARLLMNASSYIIVGGTGGLGCSLTRLLARHGANSIVLLSRSAAVSGGLEGVIEECSRKGVSVKVMACDVGDKTSVATTTRRIQDTTGPIRGVIHAAMVIRDVMFESMTFDDYQQVVNSKTIGGYNLHKEFEKTPLDFFIALSSISAIIGSRGQAAYAAANSYLDALMRYRLQNGLAGTTLNLTAVLDAGYLGEHAEASSSFLKSLRVHGLQMHEVFRLVEAALTGGIDALCAGQCITGLQLNDASELPYYASDSKFSRLCCDATGPSAGDGLQAHLLAEQVASADSRKEAVHIVLKSLIKYIDRIKLFTADIEINSDDATRLQSMGFDSLSATELRVWINKEFHAYLQLMEILSCSCIADLANLVLRKSKLDCAWTDLENAEEA